MSGIISVDFMQLLEAAEKLGKVADALDPLKDCLRREHNSLSGMSIGNTEYKIEEGIDCAERLSDEILSLKKTLEKIIVHYQITEEEQIKRVRALGNGLFSENASFDRSSDKRAGNMLVNDRSFSGHYIINEDWLNDLSDEWRGK